MPLVILCLIVIVGGLLLLYYQLGPKVSRRIGDGFSDLRDRLNPIMGGNESESERAGGNTDGQSTGDSGKSSEKKDVEGEKEDDGKVLFVYGGGECEERPLDKDEKREE
jgi:hypothetical protein